MSISINPAGTPVAMLQSGPNVKTLGRDAESYKSEKAAEAIEKFEGLFLSMMIKQLRGSENGEGFFPGDRSDTFGGMFDMFMGEHLATSADTGLDRLFQSAAGQRQLEEFAEKSAGTPGRMNPGLEEYRHEQYRAGTGQTRTDF